MKRCHICLVVVVVLGAAACTDDALCADEITAVNVHDIFDNSEDGVTVARDDNGMVTLTARERSIAVQATFPTDVELDDVIGEVELTVGTTVIGEGTEIDGYGVGPHTQSNLTAWAWRTR